MKTALSLALLSVVVSGCASRNSYTQDEVNSMNYLIRNGSCSGAYEVARSKNDPAMYFNMGLIAYECEKERERGINYFKHGARLGEQNAINVLLKLGLQVPAPDLVQQRSSSSSASDAAIGLMLLQAAQPRPAAIPMPNNNISCRSVPGSGGQINTSCW